MRIVFEHWPKSRRQLITEELKNLSPLTPSAQLIWYDLNAKDNFEYITRHKHFVQVCYNLFNNVIIHAVKAKLAQEGLLLAEYQPEIDPTDEQIAAHDNSKYGFTECVTYSMKWFPNKSMGEQDSEYFDKGLQHHYCSNEHHPEYWRGNCMPWRYIVEAVFDMAAMELERKFKRIMPQTRSEQVKLISFDDKFLYRFRTTQQFDFIKKLLALAQVEFQM
ncbi:MAG: DUF5662 family protein [Kangiellaceae bacterium]|nr:DUF5662 family protein [Kangiellaceae bacterium]